MSGTVSVRSLWPFARVLGDFRAELAFLRAHGIDEAVFADPEARIPQPLAREMLQISVARSQDPALGVHAGETIASSDFGVTDYVVRNCPDFRTALGACARYVRLLDELADAGVIEDGDRATWQMRYVIPRSPLVNDFQAVATLRIFTHLLGRDDAPLEVHLAHSEATDAREYARVFRAPVRLGAEHNAIVFPRAFLDLPIVHANPDLFEAFDKQAQRLLDQLADAESTGGRVRRLIVTKLGDGDASMKQVARQLHMSAATLRRRLAQEGTTYQHLVDEVRRELALHHIVDHRIAVAQVAFSLGFSSASSFVKAFRRWTGTTTLEYRAQARKAEHRP